MKKLGRVVICGLGVMGASLGHALICRKVAREVFGLVRRPEVIAPLLKQKLVHQASVDPAQVLPDADLVVLAQPVGQIVRQLEQIAQHLKPGVLCTDVGSVKQLIVSPAEKILRGKGHFIGAHPMTGTEKFGFENYIADLYQDMPCIVTPTRNSDPEALSRVLHFWESVGARVTQMSAPEHDHLVGFMSHLPHVVSYTLMKCLREQKEENPFLFDLAGGSFRDMTRIAGSSPDIWIDILQGNKEAILQSMESFQANWDWLKSCLCEDDFASIRRMLEDVARARQEFSQRTPPDPAGRKPKAD